MKTRHIDGLWIALALIIAVMIMFSGCMTSKNIQKQKTEERTDRTLDENIKTSSDATTKTDTRNEINTRIVEEFTDTIHRGKSEISASLQLQDILRGTILTTENTDMILITFYDSVMKVIRSQATSKEQDIPVTGKRIIDRHEIIDQTQNKNETSGSSISKSEKESTRSEIENLEKTISHSGIPGWIIVVCVVIFLVVIAFVFIKIKSGLF